MGLKMLQVDAFTAVPFKGNPAAVVFLDGQRSPEWMQNVAMEMNLSETAFLLPEGEGWRLRWFTPAVEVDLCGHATLASAHAIWEEGRAPVAGPIRFFTKSGELRAARREGIIELDFPATPVKEEAPPDGLVEALGASALFCGKTCFDWFFLVQSESAVKLLAPDFQAMGRVTERGVIVTAPASREDCDFVSRFFAPAAGINEDPVTGSAHCALGPFWSERLGKNNLKARQVSRRGGELAVRVEQERVFIGGKAVTVVRGELEG